MQDSKFFSVTLACEGGQIQAHKHTSLANMEAKVYKENPYLNSNKEPFGLTIKGKTRAYISAHKNIQKQMIKNKEIVTSKGKFKITEVSQGKGMVNAIVEVKSEDLDDIGNVEIKVYDPSSDKKKGATIEMRKMSDSDYFFVEKLRDIITCILDKILLEDEPSTKISGSTKEKRYFICKVCEWETKFESALKGHKKRMHKEIQSSQCNKCIFKTTSNKHKEEIKKRQKDTQKCASDGCESTFDTENKLLIHTNNQHSNPPIIVETQSPTSSPPRKRLEKFIEEAGDEVLDLDSMEIVVEKEFDINLKLKERIKELEIVIANLMEEKEQKEVNKSMKKENTEEIIAKSIPKHLAGVHPIHIPMLKGFKMIYKTLGNGRCLENSVAVHVFENEDEGVNVKKMVNNHIADNWENFYKSKIPLPYKETLGVGKHSRTIEIKSEEEMINFLRSEDSLVAYSNSQELLAIANLFKININIFTYRGKDGWWSEVGPDSEMTSSAEMIASSVPDLYLYNNLDTHYDLLVKEDSRLAAMGLIGKSTMDTSVNCNICVESFQQECELQTHMETKHTKENWQVVQGKKNKQEINNSQDEKLIIENECEEDKAMNITEEEITLLEGKNSGHRRTGPYTDSQKIQNTDISYKCTICKHNFESKGLLKAHVESQHVEQIKCNLCEKKFSEKDDLETHVQNEHIEETNEEWTCNDCPFQASESVELMNHMKESKHQPSLNVNKKKLYKEYKRCYTCDLEVDGYWNLMEHRKELHPSKRKCKNFPHEKCKWGKKCWYVHEEELMDVDESFKNVDPVFKCYICEEEFRTKDNLKRHRKKEHSVNVQICEKFLSNKCYRSDDDCWYNHKQKVSQLNTKEDVQVFQMAQKDSLPPDHHQKMMDTIQKLCLRVENMDKKLNTLMDEK